MPCRGFLFFCVRRKETKEDRITSKHSTKNFSIHTPLSLTAGLLFFCVRRKVAKEERIYISANPRKQTTAYRYPHPHTKFSFPIYAFREGAGGGFSRGKAFSRLTAINTPHLCKTCSKNVCILPEASQEKKRSSTGQFSIGLGKEEKCVKMLCGLKNTQRVVWIELGINGDVFLQDISLRHAGK